VWRLATLGRTATPDPRRPVGLNQGLDSRRKGIDMELDLETFRQLRRLAPVLDDILNAREVEHPDQAINLEDLAELCSRLFDAYRRMHPEEIAQARLEVLESQ
jgi:hypothetical protein